jgi:hypothetical protein
LKPCSIFIFIPLLNHSQTIFNIKILNIAACIL